VPSAHDSKRASLALARRVHIPHKRVKHHGNPRAFDTAHHASAHEALFPAAGNRYEQGLKPSRQLRVEHLCDDLPRLLRQSRVHLFVLRLHFLARRVLLAAIIQEAPAHFAFAPYPALCCC